MLEASTWFASTPYPAWLWRTWGLTFMVHSRHTWWASFGVRLPTRDASSASTAFDPYCAHHAFGARLSTRDASSASIAFHYDCARQAFSARLPSRSESSAYLAFEPSAFRPSALGSSAFWAYRLQAYRGRALCLRAHRLRPRAPRIRRAPLSFDAALVRHLAPSIPSLHPYAAEGG